MITPLLRMLAASLAILVFSSSSSYAQKCVHPDFKVELVYEVPDVEHPSVVTCDDDGNLFVGEDPMDMRGPTSKEFDRILMLKMDKDGKVVRKTVFADKLSAVFGMVWHQGKLYVMHAPHYSIFEDTNGDGVADVRKDVATGFGPPAGKFGFNDHIVTGTRLGLDGLIYVSVGDKGVPKATGSDGSTVTLEGGGVIRLRPDGSQLENFTSGTRNHLDVAMDSLDNIFTYDNTDDGRGWWTRFTHHVPTGYYGYPYDYNPRPHRHLPRISEHGGGSPVGAACYTEAAWPAKYRDAAFHCEWGKGKVQVFFTKRVGASFEAKMEDFLVADSKSTFRPLDLCFSPDGKHMYLADWQYNGWTNKAVAGRLYRITYVGKDGMAESPRAKASDPIEAQIKALGHEAHSERMRAQWQLASMGKPAYEAAIKALLDEATPKMAKIHAIWTLNAMFDKPAGATSHAGDIWISALRDKDADVRAQAARALGLRRVPRSVAMLSRLLTDEDASVRMYAAVGLGRIGHKAAIVPLLESLDDKDAYARFTKIQALRAINQWDKAKKLVTSDNENLAAAVILAATTVYDEGAVALLQEALQKAKSPELKGRAAEGLAEVIRKSDPYTGGWWGTQPAAGKPARAKKHDWAGTVAVQSALKDALVSEIAEVRLAAVKAQAGTTDKQQLAQLRGLLKTDASELVQREVMKLIAGVKDAESVSLLAASLADAKKEEATRLEAVLTLKAIAAPAAIDSLLAVAKSDATSAKLLAPVLDALVDLKAKSAAELFASKLEHADAAVRARAAKGVAITAGEQGIALLVKRLDDQDRAVRVAALQGLASLGAKSAVPEMLKQVTSKDNRSEAIIALATLADRRALGVYLEGLVDKNPDVRKAAGTAISSLKGAIGDDLLALHKGNELTPEVRRELGSLFAKPQPVISWQILGTWSQNGKQPVFDLTAAPDFKSPVKHDGETMQWKPIATKDKQGRFSLNNTFNRNEGCWAVAYTSIEAATDSPLNWTLGSDDQAVLWVNGEKVYEFKDNRGFSPESGKGIAKLKKGTNHIYFFIGNSSGPYEFGMSIGGADERLKFLYENLAPERDPGAFRDFAMKNVGDAKRGEKYFFDAQGVGCVKCHSVGERGESKIGPNLIGVGAKYPRPELVRSLLEPSNRIALGYELTIIVNGDGKVLQGIVRTETDSEVELVDAKGEVTKIAKADIDQRQKSPLSLMPNGLEKGLSLADFADIIAYLESQKQAASSGK